MFSPPTLYVAKKWKDGFFTTLYHNFGVARSPMEARMNSAPSDQDGTSFNYRCTVEPVTGVDRHYIAPLPRNKLKDILSDTGVNPDKLEGKKLFFTLFTSSPDHHGDHALTDIDLVVSDSLDNLPERPPYLSQDLFGEAQHLKMGESDEAYTVHIVEGKEVNVRGYALAPCRMRGYNIASLNPVKALHRWHKRLNLERSAHKPNSLCFHSLSDELGYDSRDRCAAGKGGHENFAALDLGCGALSNIWTAVVEKGIVPAQSIHGLDVDEDTLLAARCVYGPELARFGFDWKNQVKRGDALAMPYENGKFDFIMAVNALENVTNSMRGVNREMRDREISREDRNENAKAFFQEMARVLKGSGRLYLSTFEAKSEGSTDLYAFTENELHSFTKDTPFYFVPWLHLKHYDYPRTDMTGKPTGKHVRMMSFCCTKT